MEWEASMEDLNTKGKCVVKEQRDELSRGCFCITCNRVIFKVLLESCLILFEKILTPLSHPNCYLQDHCSISLIRASDKPKFQVDRPYHILQRQCLTPLLVSREFQTSQGTGQVGKPPQKETEEGTFTSSHL